MKILYHHRTLGDGAEGIHIHEMVEAWRQLGNEVRVVSLIGEQINDATPQRKRWENVSRLIPSSAYELAELASNVIGTRKVLQAVAEFQPDFIYDRYNSYSTAALRAAHKVGLPIILEVNAPVAYERVAYAFRRLRFPWLARHYERRICSAADRIVTVSTALKAYLVQERGVRAEKISVLPNAINPDRFHQVHGAPVRDKYKLNGQLVIGFVGSLRAWHGVDLMMQVIPDILREYAQCHFLIVGAGELEQAVRQDVQDMGLSDKITLTGWIPYHEVPGYIAEMDITLMPNSNFYGSPMKVFEYMAMGRPVIAPRLGPLEEIIDHNVNGILITPGNKEMFKDSIVDLIKDPQKRMQIGKQARSDVFQYHTWEQNAAQVIGIYNQILN